jgi:hypothetical protein
MEAWHKYYCPLRPPDLGATPLHPVRVEFGACEVNGRCCHGAVWFDRRLSAVEVERYELIPAEEEKQ